MKIGDRVESGTECGTVVDVRKEDFRVEWDSKRFSHLNVYWHGPEKISAGYIVPVENLPAPMDVVFTLEEITEYDRASPDL